MSDEGTSETEAEVKGNEKKIKKKTHGRRRESRALMSQKKNNRTTLIRDVKSK